MMFQRFGMINCCLGGVCPFLDSVPSHSLRRVCSPLVSVLSQYCCPYLSAKSSRVSPFSSSTILYLFLKCSKKSLEKGLSVYGLTPESLTIGASLGIEKQYFLLSFGSM